MSSLIKTYAGVHTSFDLELYVSHGLDMDSPYSTAFTIKQGGRVKVDINLSKRQVLELARDLHRTIREASGG